MHDKRETVIWLVRHAETATPTYFHGAESDVELGEHGHRQAAAAAGWFAERKPTVVVSSAMKARGANRRANCSGRVACRTWWNRFLHERMVGPLSVGRVRKATRCGTTRSRSGSSAKPRTRIRAWNHFDAIRDRTLPAFRRRD